MAAPSFQHALHPALVFGMCLLFLALVTLKDLVCIFSTLCAVPSQSQGSLAQLSDWQIDLLIFVATNIGPMVSLKDLRVTTRGDLTLGWHLGCFFVLVAHTHRDQVQLSCSWYLRKKVCQEQCNMMERKSENTRLAALSELWHYWH